MDSKQAKGIAVLLRVAQYYARVFATALCILASASGCSLVDFGDATNLDEPIAPPAKRQTGDAAPAASDEVTAALAIQDWAARAAVAQDSAAKTKQLDHWRHEGLEGVVSREDARSRLRAALRSENAIVAANAAIGLASYGDVNMLPRLIEAARTTTFKLSLRGAAIEAIGRLDTPAADDAIEELIGEVGRFNGIAKARYVPELHADLIRAVARRSSGSHEKSLKDALTSPAAAVRLQAAQAYQNRDGPCPAELIDLTADQAASVRAAALRSLVHARHEEAQNCVERALADHDLSVRLCAVESLGVLSAPENGVRLHELCESSSEVIRAAAVGALGRSGDLQSVERAASDKSWRVRRAVAECVQIFPATRRDPIARRLLNDPNLEVQRSMVASLAHWPINEAVPLLLLALDGPAAAATRHDAATQLRSRWAAAESLPPHAPPQRLADEASRLRQIWERESARYSHGQPDGFESDGAPRPAETEVDAQALERLKDRSVQERRAAIRALLNTHGDKLLPADVLARIAECMERELDGLVWADVLTVIANDGRQGAFELAAASASHPNSEVRRRACHYFGQHPTPRAAEVLLNSLSDNDATVIREAVRALGHQPEIADLAPLEKLLTSPDETLRIDAAEALARLGSQPGMSALLRTTYHHDATLRRQAAAALGGVFAGPQRAEFSAAQLQEATVELQRLLNDRGEVRRAAQASLDQIAAQTP
jgi:HEAT repeat protein